MMNAELLREWANKLHPLEKYGYDFCRYDYKKHNPDLPDLSTIATESINRARNRRIHIAYMNTDVYDTPRHLFWCTISALSPATALPVYIEKYLLMHYGSNSLQNMSLNAYPGDYPQKLSAFTSFIADLLSEALLNEVLKGEAWSDAYYKPLWEGTDR